MELLWEAFFWLLGVYAYTAFVFVVIEWVRSLFYHETLHIEYQEDGETEDWGDNSETLGDRFHRLYLRMLTFQFLYFFWIRYFVPGSVKELLYQWLQYETSDIYELAIIGPSWDFTPSAVGPSRTPPDFSLYQAEMALVMYVLIPQFIILLLALVPRKIWTRLGAGGAAVFAKIRSRNKRPI